MAESELMADVENSQLRLIRVTNWGYNEIRKVQPMPPFPSGRPKAALLALGDQEWPDGTRRNKPADPDD